MRLKHALKSICPTDGPGYTDYPRVDIEAHRANAKWTRRFGWFWFAIGLAAVATGGGYEAAAVGFAVLVIAHVASADLRIQALEWESELEDIGETDD